MGGDMKTDLIIVVDSCRQESVRWVACSVNLRLRSFQGSTPARKSDGSTGDSYGCETSETLVVPKGDGGRRLGVEFTV
jgi:hypothetical protein